MTRPTIVSIHSQLVFGCAGNNAVVPVLRALGATVYGVPTTILSNTPHYPSISGEMLDATLIENLLDRLLERVGPGEISAIVTGYLSSAEAAAATARFIDRVRYTYPGVLVACDPVMGDTNSGLYVDAEVAAALQQQLIPRADILTPNIFEACKVSGINGQDVLSIFTRLLSQGPQIVAITGITAQADRVTSIAGDANDLWRVESPRLDLCPTGTGDIFTASFMYQMVCGSAINDALAAAVEAVFLLLERCQATGAVELEPYRFMPQGILNLKRFVAEKISDDRCSF